MPFDEEKEKIVSGKKGIKQVSSQKSMFDAMPKKTSPQDFENQVRSIQEKEMGYKNKASDLSGKFLKILTDKTLKVNKGIFSLEMERELLTQMVQLAIDINNDPHENEGMGSLGWITLLLKISLLQRDRLNSIEYQISNLEKKCDTNVITTLINRELQALDKKKSSE